MKTNTLGIELIKRYEGLRLQAYRDIAGVWTVGFGHTQGVTEGMVITKKEADNFLKKDVKDAERAVKELVTVPLNENQFSALVSFVFSVGEQAFRNSTLLLLLNQGKYQEVRNQLLRWCYVTDPVTRRKMRAEGLYKRRIEESNLFNAPVA